MTDTAATTEEVFTPLDFVYAGRRMGRDGKMYHVIYTLKDGVLDERSSYDAKVFGRHGLGVGAVYRGAAFSGKAARNLSQARWHAVFHDKDKRAEWEALDADYAMEVAAASAEKRHKSVVQEQLLDLRRTMHAMRKRGAHVEVEALMNLIVAELRRPLTAEERNE